MRILADYDLREFAGELTALLLHDPTDATRDEVFAMVGEAIHLDGSPLGLDEVGRLLGYMLDLATRAGEPSEPGETKLSCVIKGPDGQIGWWSGTPSHAQKTIEYIKAFIADNEKKMAERRHENEKKRVQYKDGQ